MAALTRVSSGQHKRISVNQNDVVIFSSSPIPGNEKAVSKVMNGIAKRGAAVINKATHVSGHACEEELKLIYALTNPQYAVPVHGEYMHRKANADLAKMMKIPEKNIFLLDSGDVLTLSKKKGEKTGNVVHGAVLVDGLGVGDVGNVVLKDRQNLSQDGIVVVVVSISKGTGEILSGPEILSRGFVYVKTSDGILEEMRSITEDAVWATLKKRNSETQQIKNAMKDALADYIWKTIHRNPVILPIVMEEW